MATAIIEKKYYNAESPEASDIYALMQVVTELPPAPYVGLTVRSGRSIYELERIWWDVDEQKFSCTAKPSFLDRMSVDSPDFDEWIEWQKADGWILRGRYDNDAFVAEQENSTLDDDEKFRTQVSKLFEPARLELRRRLDEAACLGRLIVAEKRALEIAREKWKTKTAEAKNLTNWGLGLLLVMALIDWLFPEWIENKNTYLLLLFGMGVLNLAYNELICPPLASDIEKRREAYEDACHRWSVATGMLWGKKALAAECESHNYSYPFVIEEDRASPEEIEDHWASVERSVMRIVKNRYALSRYDL